MPPKGKQPRRSPPASLAAAVAMFMPALFVAGIFSFALIALPLELLSPVAQHVPAWVVWVVECLAHAALFGVPVVVASVLSLRAYKETRWENIPPGCCQNCGYDLTGNTSGRCPECGEPVEAEG